MSYITFTKTVTMETHDCCNCGMMFSMTADFVKRRREDHAFWYCPKGHQQHFTADSEAEKIRKERDRLKQNEAYLESRIAAEQKSKEKLQREITKMRKRESAGTCPCCQRTFANMAEHMKSEHPERLKENGTNIVPIKRKRKVAV